MTTRSDAKEATGGAGAAQPHRAGFSKEGKAYPGVDPDTGERKALTYEGAQKEFGPKTGAELYHAVALAGGFGRVEGNPDLSLVGLDGEPREKVEKILANAEKE
ncbi:MAG TPA: hypothetical protein VF297_05235 [Pyrinomonadaceae bacterium]